MADIKTRELVTGTIKTLDRSVSSIHRIKDDIVRTKSDEIRGSDDDGSAEAYAQDTAEHYVGSGAMLAADFSMEMAVHSSRKPPSDPDVPPDKDDQIRQAFREEGAKAIRERQNRAKMADAEVIGNNEELRDEGRILQNKGQIARKRRRSPISAADQEAAFQRQREYGRRKLIFEKRNGGRPFFSGKRIVYKDGKIAEGISRFLKDLLEGTKVLIASLSAGGAAALLIVVIMVLFGAALTMTDDGNRIVGIGDEAIVEVARAELGNKGGEKYWKWYGFSSRVDWCAIFCSWCADQCGYIEAGTLPKFSVVGDGANWFRNRHRWAGRGYSPRPGDFIFFDYQQNGELDHVGIVENCDGKTVTTIEGNSGDACKRQSYIVGSSSIAGYGLSVSMTSMTFEKACAWAEKIAEDGSYHYVVYSNDPKTQECPVCNNHPEGRYRGWNCIGFAFACWRHGAGINCKCSCDVINNAGWDYLLTCASDAEASQFASKQIGVPCKVIRNGGKAIPVSRLKQGDILTMYEGETSYHTIFYEGNGKYADCTSGRGNNIRAGNSLSQSDQADIKIAIRYGG